MVFAERLAAIRKAKHLSQADVRQRLDLKGDTYGRYERGEVKPSIEVAAKIARGLDVSLDYLAGLTDHSFDLETLNRMVAISQLAEADRRQVYLVIDALLRDFQARKLYK